MPLKKCRECGHAVSSEAPACPQCGAPPKSQRQGGCAPFLALAIIIAVGWHFLAPNGSLDSLIKLAKGTTGNSVTAATFPVGSYKYLRATYVTLNSDNTFTVKSDEFLWNCKGKWSFDGTTLNMQADADEKSREWIPYIFHEPAKLLSRGSEIVVWECLIYRFEWKKID